jgi:hypothetical protein
METDDTQRGKTWLAGQFNRGPLNVLEQVLGTTTLVEQGIGGLTPRLLPESLRRPIADRKLVQQAWSLPPEAPAGR